jgi:hypothetical protein
MTGSQASSRRRTPARRRRLRSVLPVIASSLGHGPIAAIGTSFGSSYRPNWRGLDALCQPANWRKSFARLRARTDRIGACSPMSQSAPARRFAKCGDWGSSSPSQINGEISFGFLQRRRDSGCGLSKYRSAWGGYMLKRFRDCVAASFAVLLAAPCIAQEVSPPTAEAPTGNNVLIPARCIRTLETVHDRNRGICERSIHYYRVRRYSNC